MDENKFNLFNFIREHKFKVIGLSLAAVLFSLLIIEAIYLLTPPNFNSNSGSRNRKSASSDNSNRRNESENDNNSKMNPYENPSQGAENKDRAPSGDNKGNGTKPYENYGQIDPKLRESIKGSIPDIHIDLGRNKDYSKMPQLGGSNSFSIQAGKKLQHAPILEVAGVTETGFLRTAAMDDFESNRWMISPNAYYEEYKSSNTKGLKSVKLKPFYDAKGFIPAPCNSLSVRFPIKDIVNFPSNNMFYTDKLFSDYYEAFYSSSQADEEVLKDLKVENTNYNIKNMDDITNIARNVTVHEVSSYEKMRAIEKYLKENYTIDNSKGSGDFSYSASDFFKSKKGSGLDFVSSFVLMLRSINIPARISVGYKVDPGKNYQIVYADQLYVYAEVKFEDIGWFPVDYFASNLYTPPVNTKVEITSVEKVAKKGTEFNVSGKVTDSAGNPVDGIPVMIYVKKDKDEGCLAYEKGEVLKGEFHVKGTVNMQMDVGVYNIVAHAVENDKYKGSWSDPEMKVTSDTNISMTASSSVFEDMTLTMEGTVLEEQTSKLIKDGRLKFTFGDGLTPVKDESVSIGNKGEFSKKLKLNIKKGIKPQKDYFLIQSYKTSYTANYMGTDFYMPSAKKGELYVYSIIWYRVIVIFVLLLVSCAVVLVLYLKKKKGSVLRTASDVSIDIDNILLKYSKDTWDTTIAENITITFPQINPPFPEVWGVNDPLAIRFTADNGDSDEKIVDFCEKGTKTITIYSESKDIVCQRDIRIVSYREEITSEVKKILERFGVKFEMHNTRKMTAREIVGRISPELKDSVKEELMGIIYVFESAAYSMRPVKRTHYEQCFKYILVLNNWLEEVRDGEK